MTFGKKSSLPTGTEKKRRIKVAVSVLTFVLTAVLFLVINTVLTERMELLKTRMVEHLEKQLNCSISYTKISPTIFMFLEVRNLDLREQDTLTEILHINKLKIHYNIFALLFNSDPLKSVHEINISNTAFDFNPEKNRKIMDFLTQLPPLPHPLPYNIKISGSNLTLNLVHNGYQLDCTDLFFTVGSDHGFYNIKINKSQIRLSRSKQAYKESKDALLIADSTSELDLLFASRIKAITRVSNTLEWIDGEVNLGDFTTNLWGFKNLTFQVSCTKGNINITTIKDKEPLNLKAVIVPGVSVSLNMEAENYIPTRQFSFSQNWSPLNPLLSSSLNSRGTLDWDLLAGSINYRLYLQANYQSTKTVFTTEISGNEEKLEFRALDLELPQGAIAFRGSLDLHTFFPAGNLFFQNVVLPSQAALNGLVSFTPYRDHLEIQGNSLELGHRTVRLEAQITPQAHTFHLNTLITYAGIANKEARISLVGTIFSQSQLSLQLVTENLPLLDLLAFSFNSGLASSVNSDVCLNSAYSINLDGDLFNLKSTSLEIVDGSDPDNIITADLLVNNSSIQINRIIGSWNHYSMQAAIGIFKLSPDKFRLGSHLELQGIEYDFSGEYSAAGGLKLFGSYGFALAYYPKNNANILNLSTDQFPVPLGATQAKFSVILNGYFINNHNWQIASSSFVVTDLPLIRHTRSSRLALQFILTNNAATFSSLEYSDDHSTLSGLGDLTIQELLGDENQPIQTYIGNFYLLSADKLEAYSVKIRFSDRYFDVKTEFMNSPIARFSPLAVVGKTNGLISFFGPYSAPAVNIYLKSTGLRILNERMDVTLNAEYINNQLNIQLFDLRYLDIYLSSRKGFYNFLLGKYDIDFDLSLNYLRHALKSRIKLVGVFNTKAKTPTELFLGYKINTIFSIYNLTIDKIPYPDWSVLAKSTENKLYIDSQTDKSLVGRFNEQGEFTITLGQPFAITGQWAGKLKDNYLSSDFTNAEISLSFLNPFISEDTLTFERGIMSGDLNISGLVSDPDFNGSLQVTGAVLSYIMCPNKTDEFNTNLVFDAKTITMETITTKAGPTVLLADGVFSLSHWGISDFSLQFWTEKNTSLAIVHDFGPIFVKGRVSGKVTYVSTPDGQYIDGDLLIDDCTTTMGEPTNLETQTSGGSPLFVRMKLTSGNRVEFIWPSFNLPIVKAFAGQGTQVSINYDGIIEKLDLTGDVAIQAGEVFYFGRNFYIKEGLLRFNESFEDIDPIISLRAELREKDAQNQDLFIYLIVNNQKLSEFSPVFRSSPAKSEQEILAMLGGYIPENLNTDVTGYSALLLSTNFASQFGLIRPFEQKVREILNLDLFSIRTHFIENLIFENIMATGHVETTPPGIGSYLDKTTITFGKYIGKDIFLEASLFLNEGVDNQLQTDFLVSIEFPTPFFDLKWAFKPKYDLMNSTFFPENILILSWYYTF